MMKKALLSLLLAFVCLPTVFAQSAPGFALNIDSVTSCNDYTWPRNNTQYTHDTVAVYTAGDTTYVLYYTRLASYVDTANAIELYGDCSVNWNGKTWNEMGSFLDTLTAVSGCDSVVRLDISLASIDSVKEISVCGSYTAPWGGAPYTESCVIDTTITSDECSYHTTITLTVNPEYTNNATLEVAAGCYYMWNNLTVTDTNLHSMHFTTAAGCDSVVSVRVTGFSGTQVDSITIVACDEYTPSWRDVITESGVYTHDSVYGTYLSAEGTQPCQHNEIYNVTIVTSVDDSADVVPTNITAGCSYTWNGIQYTDTAVHYHLYTSVIGGCDSMAAIKINYTGMNYDTTYANYCGDTYRWKTNCPSLPLTEDYSFTHDIDTTVVVNDTAAGCATYYTLVLRFNTKTDTIEKYYCGNVYTFNDFKKYDATSQRWINASADFTTSGYFTMSDEGDTLIAIASGSNCKTYQTLHLDLNIPDIRYRADSIDTAVCESFRFKADRKYGNNITLTASCDSDFVAIQRNQQISNRDTRCYDSIVHVHLIIYHNSYIERTATACDEYVWEEFDGKTYTESGTYRDTLSARTADGCLQIGRLRLTINKTPQIDIEGEWMLQPGESTILKAIPAADSDPISSYKWYIGNTVKSDCDSLVLENVTDNTDIRLESKSNKNCTATNWITVTANVGIDEIETLQVNIYPNPASRYLNIESAEAIANVTVYNTVGQQVVSQKANGNTVRLDLGDLTSGTYTLRISGVDGNLTTRKFIINK